MTLSTTLGSNPAFAVDTHAHVYNLTRYPIHESSGFSILANETGTAEQYAAVLDAHRISHAVLINPLGGYGIDNRNMLDVIASSNGRFKGIAVVPHDISEAQLDTMVQTGVVGIRFNLSFPASPAIKGAGGARLLSLAEERGLIVQVHYHDEAHLLEANDILKACQAPIVIDHCGRPVLDRGINQAGFQALLELGRSHNAIIKLSALFRCSRQGWPYLDTDRYVEKLIDAFSVERCIWGSDWPFLRAGTRIDYGPELSGLSRWLSDVEDRRKVLWKNPFRIFGFQGE
ncbi:amidohydrolase family protein [Paralcaligenes sp. KSB-10]|uniref:amidohydrolase family protein n=1 Tax=Paralcaligenes sp. KSB-10 TaxID=2901142 RepID=UPI001E2DED7D|nr:amidohydrolase family protein [Paralcaligenes sp. KSB-10]UHL64664.1 amidohydrolase family protein [Paralcaligenes sp. KSB-10]